MSTLEERIITAIKTITDPELPINIYELGLIRAINIDGDKVQIDMTLTTPNCPVADLMPSQVFEEVSKVEGIASVRVALVWEPAWSVADLSKRGKSVLELMDIDINHMLAKINANTTGLTVGKKNVD
ncbi:MAG: iron-sulfur cluster assembly protein [Phycisphaerales bacterium]|jgi:metal-sulfur cluster biosynthetic enzyme